MITSISPEQFLLLKHQYIVIDVRSPSEYIKGHLPDSYNIPLFSDDQRALVGTIYKHQGKMEALLLGLELVGPQLQRYMEQVKNYVAEKSNPLIIYCQRGGMRSKSFGMLLASHGYTVYQLTGGQKAYKAFVRQQAQRAHQFIVLGGKTGCGKTKILQELQKQGEQVLDLESLAQHKGSVFGGLGQNQQPSQEQFIIDCCTMLAQFDAQRPIWVEKESYKIGNLSLPAELWYPLQQAPIIYIDLPKTERIQFLLQEYGTHDTTALKTCIQMLQKKIGSPQVKNLCALVDKNQKEKVADLLLDYYDKLYTHSLQKSSNNKVLHLQLQNKSIEEYAYQIKQVFRA